MTGNPFEKEPFKQEPDKPELESPAPPPLGRPPDVNQLPQKVEYFHELEYSDALNLFLASFRFSRGNAELQHLIISYVHRRLPIVGLSQRVRKQLMEEAPAKAYSMVQKREMHRKKVTREDARIESRRQITQMGKALNTPDAGVLQDSQLLWTILHLMIARDYLFLINPAQEPDPKLEALLRKKFPRLMRRSTKLERLNENPGKYIASANRDPWASDVCIYLILGGRVPYDRLDDIEIPAIIWQMFAELRSMLCYLLKRDYQKRQADPYAPVQYWDTMEHIVKAYNEAPHPREKIHLPFFVQTCI